MTFQVTWYKDGSEVKPGKVFQVVYSLGICSLETSCCELSDAGKFTCKAENSLGSDECSCKVTVAGKNIFHRIEGYCQVQQIPSHLTERYGKR